MGVPRARQVAHCFLGGNDEKHGANLYVFYILFFIYYWALAISVGYKSQKIFRKKLKDKIVNVYQLIQYGILLVYWFITVLHFSLKFIKWYEFHNDGNSNLVFFVFLLSEVVNISWWVNILMHIRYCAYHMQKNNTTLNNRKIAKEFKKIKFKEKIEVVILVIFMTGYAVWNIGIFVYSLVEVKCNGCHPFYHRDDLYCKLEQWKNILDYFRITHHMLTGLASFVVIMKIGLGIYLLHLLRKNLNHYWRKRKRGIIFTIIASCTVVTMRALYYVSAHFRMCDLKHNFPARMSFPIWEGPAQLFLSIIDASLPMAVMYLNIANINFEMYLLALIRAWELQRFSEEVSIFIYYRKEEFLISNWTSSSFEDRNERSSDRTRMLNDFTCTEETSHFDTMMSYKRVYEENSRLERTQRTVDNHAQSHIPLIPHQPLISHNHSANIK